MTQAQQPEALRLAAICETKGMFPVADELNRMHARILELEQGKCLLQIAEPAAPQAVQPVAPQLKANCYSDDNGDYWRDCPDDYDFVEGLKVGDTYELQASIRAWSETFRVTKAPDETSDDYEVELVSSDAPAHPAEGVPAQAVQPQQAMEALKTAMKADPEYAWSWHCAIWSGAHDEGLETGAANRAAARVMHMAFDCDTTKNANFHATHLAATQPAEAARSVLAERARQIAAEGWTSEQDDAYNPGVLAEAGGIYALHAFDPFRAKEAPEGWPWSPGWWKPKDPRTNLVKAGALILAEIERIDRTYAAQQPKEPA